MYADVFDVRRLEEEIEILILELNRNIGDSDYHLMRLWNYKGQ